MQNNNFLLSSGKHGYLKSNIPRIVALIFLKSNFYPIAQIFIILARKFGYGN